MTYCVAVRLSHGLVMMSDTRTNAGVDNISTYRKLTTWEVEGDRAIALLGAGNLATTQALISRLDERTKIPDERDPSLLQAPTMFQLATLIGNELRDVIAEQSSATNGSSGGATQMDPTFGATMILAGQIAPGVPTIFMIYPEGNFVEVSEDTPFFQIGETKYGRPILLRAYDPDMSFDEAIRLLLISFDSTIKANLSVDLPIDWCLYDNDSYQFADRGRVEISDSYFTTLSEDWGEALKRAVASMPEFSRADD
ncbi:MAG: peptidase [Pseudomonadota bacterium]